MKFWKFTLFLAFILYSSGYSYTFFSSSEQGIGLRQYQTTVRGMGMGGTGLATPSVLSLNAYNIATWRHIENTRINLSMYYDMSNTELDNQNFSSSTGNFSGLQLAVPIQRQKWVFGISLTPYTNVDFSYNQKYTEAGVSYEENTFYKGNLARAQVNLVWSPVARVGIGASFNYYFGTIQDRYRLIFGTAELLNSSYEIEYQFHGPGAGLSAEVLVADSLFVGGFVDLKPSLNFYKVSNSPITYQREEIQTKSSLPVFWGVGSTYHFAGQWNVSADLAYQFWSQGFNIETFKTNNLEDWYHTGVGLEHTHSNKRNSSFLNKFDIRSGFSAGNIGYQFDNNSVMEYAGSFGLGFPFYEGKARLDLALQAGIRGNKSRNIAQEKFYRFFISLSAGELWFQKFR